MKCFIIAYCKSEIRVLLPSFNSVEVACDYCLRVYKYDNEIKMCEVYSVGKHLTKREAIVYNFGKSNLKTPKCVVDDDDLPF